MSSGIVVHMATEEGVLLASKIQCIDDFRAVTMAVLVRLFAVVVGVVWLLFWGLVARLQAQQGEFLSAAVVTGLFLVPAIFGTGYYLRSSIPIE